MFGEDVLDQKITTLEFLITEFTAPHSLFWLLFALHNEPLNLLPQQTCVLRNLRHLRTLRLCVLLDLLENCLHVGQLHVVSLSPQEHRAGSQSQHPLVFVLRASVVVKSVNFTKIGEQYIEFLLKSVKCPLEQGIILNAYLHVQLCYECAQSQNISL
jgi:hypothetical protein